MTTNQNDTPGHAVDAEKPGCRETLGAGHGLADSACSARWVFECPICEKTVRPEETENHISDHAEALREAEILIDEIMRGVVNPEDEAEKWLREFAPQFLRQDAPDLNQTNMKDQNEKPDAEQVGSDGLFADLLQQWKARAKMAEKIANDAAGISDYTTRNRCTTKASVIRSMIVELEREISQANDHE